MLLDYEDMQFKHKKKTVAVKTAKTSKSETLSARTVLELLNTMPIARNVDVGFIRFRMDTMICIEF